MTGLELSDRWWGHQETSEPAEAKRAAVLRELSLEIDPGHELSGQVVRVEAFFEASDDVIVGLVDGTFALVHPTWTGRTEPPPHPTAIRLGSGAAASEEVARWELSR